jgi:hypothetical protein
MKELTPYIALWKNSRTAEAIACLASVGGRCVFAGRTGIAAFILVAACVRGRRVVWYRSRLLPTLAERMERLPAGSECAVSGSGEYAPDRRCWRCFRQDVNGKARTTPPLLLRPDLITGRTSIRR